MLAQCVSSTIPILFLCLVATHSLASVLKCVVQCCIVSFCVFCRQRTSPIGPQDHAPSEQEDAIPPQDRELFTQRYTSFLESRGTPQSRSAMLGQKELDLCRLYKMVTEIGGMDRVTQEMKWQSIHLRLGMPSLANASYAINRAYKR